MSDQWYYQRGNERIGPVPLTEIENAIKKNRLLEQTFVWAEHLPGWQQAGTLAELKPIFLANSFQAHFWAAVPLAVLSAILIFLGFAVVPFIALASEAKGPWNLDPHALGMLLGRFVFQFGGAAVVGAFCSAALRRGRSLIIVFLLVLAFTLVLGFLILLGSARV